MNNYILKIIIFYILLSLSLAASSLSHQEINKMVSKIKEERIGIDLSTLEDTPNPFAIVEKLKEEKVEQKVKIEKPKVVKKVVTHRLVAILNRAAFIDGKWYKVGDKVGRYRVSNISQDRVTLESATESKQLVLPKREKKFKMFRGD